MKKRKGFLIAVILLLLLTACSQAVSVFNETLPDMGPDSGYP